MKLKKHQPDYDIDDFLSPTHGDFKDKIGRVTEINIGPWGIHYGLVDLPCSWGQGSLLQTGRSKTSEALITSALPTLA